MTGSFGFSYIGLLFLLMLFLPNILWTKNMPQGYSAERENKILLLFERTGEALTSCCALVFSDFNISQWTAWSWWLVAAFGFMALYELWWIRYFRSRRSAACSRIFPSWHLRQSHMDADCDSHFGDWTYRYSFATQKINR